MKISIINSQDAVKLNSGEIKRIAADALGAVGEKEAELSVYLVDDSEMRRLNFHYRNVDRPTDVLAFSMREGEPLEGAEGILGDVVISAQTALRQARRYRKSLKDELNLYLVHGILHLIGYDDNSARARKKMEKLQEEILRMIRGF